MFDPSIGRWLTPDPVGLGGEDENLYRYAQNNPANRVDPSGLWSIRRDGKPTAEAVSEKNDTLIKLGNQIGIDAGWKTWATPGLPATLANGNAVKGLNGNDQLADGQKVAIPNTILYIWLGWNGAELGPRATGWYKDMKRMEMLGFNVEEIQYDKDNAKKADEILKKIETLSKQKALHGIVIAGHGAANKAWSHQDKNKVELYYSDIQKVLQYRLGAVVMNVCQGGWSNTDAGYPVPGGGVGGRDLAGKAPATLFYGIKETLVPPFETQLLSDFYKDKGMGYQGTKTAPWIKLYGK